MNCKNWTGSIHSLFDHLFRKVIVFFWPQQGRSDNTTICSIQAWYKGAKHVAQRSDNIKVCWKHKCIVYGYSLTVIRKENNNVLILSLLQYSPGDKSWKVHMKLPLVYLHCIRTDVKPHRTHLGIPKDSSSKFWSWFFSFTSHLDLVFCVVSYLVNGSTKKATIEALRNEQTR